MHANGHNRRGSWTSGPFPDRTANMPNDSHAPRRDSYYERYPPERLYEGPESPAYRGNGWHDDRGYYDRPPPPERYDPYRHPEGEAWARNEPSWNPPGWVDSRLPLEWERQPLRRPSPAEAFEPNETWRHSHRRMPSDGYPPGAPMRDHSASRRAEEFPPAYDDYRPRNMEDAWTHDRHDRRAEVHRVEETDSYRADYERYNNSWDAHRANDYYDREPLPVNRRFPEYPDYEKHAPPDQRRPPANWGPSRPRTPLGRNRSPVRPHPAVSTPGSQSVHSADFGTAQPTSPPFSSSGTPAHDRDRAQVFSHRDATKKPPVPPKTFPHVSPRSEPRAQAPAFNGPASLLSLPLPPSSVPKLPSHSVPDSVDQRGNIFPSFANAKQPVADNSSGITRPLTATSSNGVVNSTKSPFHESKVTKPNQIPPQFMREPSSATHRSPVDKPTTSLPPVTNSLGNVKAALDGLRLGETGQSSTSQSLSNLVGRSNGAAPSASLAAPALPDGTPTSLPVKVPLPTAILSSPSVLDASSAWTSKPTASLGEKALVSTASALRSVPEPAPPIRESRPQGMDAKSLVDALRYSIIQRREFDRQTYEERINPILAANLITVGQPETEPETQTDVVSEVMEKFRREAIQIPFATTRAKLALYMAERQVNLNEKTRSLREEYLERHKEWIAHCARLDDASRSYEPEETAVTATTSRATRRSLMGLGDAVRSDLEMELIIASLGNEELTDPNHLALRNLATIPDMLSTVGGQTEYTYDDSNTLVLDPHTFYAPQTGFLDWTEEEKNIFVREFAAAPKQFGIIAEALEDKTPAQCVVFYYLHKKKFIDFRKVITLYAPKRRRGGRKTDKRKGNALLADIARHDEVVSKGRATRGRKPKTSAMGDETATPTPERDLAPKQRKRRTIMRTCTSTLEGEDIDGDISFTTAVP